jgi:hypothetical protein
VVRGGSAFDSLDSLDAMITVVRERSECRVAGLRHAFNQSVIERRLARRRRIVAGR